MKTDPADAPSDVRYRELKCVALFSLYDFTAHDNIVLIGFLANRDATEFCAFDVHA